MTLTGKTPKHTGRKLFSSQIPGHWPVTEPGR